MRHSVSIPSEIYIFETEQKLQHQFLNIRTSLVNLYSKLELRMPSRDSILLLINLNSGISFRFMARPDAVIQLWLLCKGI